ncbi:glycosyltransferase [Streptomyces sp. NPDC057743]|uniref:glycosyltransferase n=1 Tax=Streptomyces sp. NPDC057743 TaxID=3346236 RepID=UPI00369A2728
MNILLTAAGSLGDIAPYTGLGARLRTAGHEVTVATHDTYAPLVRAAGLTFRPLPADPRATAPADAATTGTPTTRRALLRRAATFIEQLGASMADATTPDTDLLLLSTTTAPLGWHLAEALDIPSVGAYLQPTAPTRAFAPAVGGARSLGGWGNRAAGHLSLRIVDRLYTDAVRALRTRLDLPPTTPRAARRRTEAANWPVLHGFSELLVPRPTDWRPGLTLTGHWWPHLAPDAQLPAELEDFLTSGPPPVAIGFGSMTTPDTERLGTLAVRALRRANTRGILLSGTTGLASPSPSPSDDILTLTTPVPHALLFPRLAAAVHHCGAGTAAAALRAGIPSVPVPFTGDQPFWAARLAALGAATPALPFTTLTKLPLDDAVTRLATALTQATTTPALRTRAQSAAHHLATEDGPTTALHTLTHHLTP